MNPNWALVVSTCTGLISLVALLRTFAVGAHEAQARSAAALNTRLDALDVRYDALANRLTILETRMEPLVDLIRQHLSARLRRPTHTEMDALLEKHRGGTLTLTDARTLRRWLDEAYLHNPAMQTDEQMGAVAVAVLVAWAVDDTILRLEHPRPPSPRGG